jgi:hypothetical protein
MPSADRTAKVQGCTRGRECWRWYARGVARHCRPQGAVASNVIALRTNVLAGPGGPIGAAQGQASGATQPDFQSARRPGSEPGEYQPRFQTVIAAGGTREPPGQAVLNGAAIRSLRVAVRTAHLHGLPGSLSPTTLLPLTTVSRFLLRVGRNGKRYRRHHPASRPGGRLAGTYPYNSKQSNPASCTATRLQLRCNPGSHRNVRTRLEIP